MWAASITKVTYDGHKIKLYHLNRPLDKQLKSTLSLSLFPGTYLMGAAKKNTGVSCDVLASHPGGIVMLLVTLNIFI